MVDCSTIKINAGHILERSATGLILSGLSKTSNKIR
jgi:hypothetical protein